MINILLTPLKELIQFIYWWVFSYPKKIFGWIYNTLLAADEVLVIGETVRLWFAIEPMFGDYNWRGRLIGFIFRFARILVSITFYVVIVVVGLIAVLTWLIWPVVASTLILYLW